MATLVQRMIGAAKLDVATYEEVEADKGATGQAMAVVVLSAAAGGIGAIDIGGVRGFAQVALLGILAWFVWALLTWFVGTKLLPEPETKSDMGELLRTIGFSATPGLLRVLGGIPIAGPLINFLAVVWMLIAMVVAVRQALDFRSTLRAMIVCILGFMVYIAILVGAALFLGLGGAMLGDFVTRGTSA